nr:hypothetical protein Iba_chr12aCG10220 [Ipomoea batatas]
MTLPDSAAAAPSERGRRRRPEDIAASLSPLHTTDGEGTIAVAARLSPPRLPEFRHGGRERFRGSSPLKLAAAVVEYCRSRSNAPSPLQCRRRGTPSCHPASHNRKLGYVAPVGKGVVGWRSSRRLLDCRAHHRRGGENGKGDEDAEIASPCYCFAESTAVDVRESQGCSFLLNYTLPSSKLLQRGGCRRSAIDEKKRIGSPFC